MENIVGLKSLRENMQKYVRKVQKGYSFIIFRKSKPLFKISPIEENLWEEVIDFTKIKRGGVNIKDLMQRL